MLIQFVTYIFLPLLIAYITIVVTKRKEVELEAQGLLLEHRVKAYSEVYRFMQRNLRLIAVPRYLEHLYVCCLDGADYKIGVQGMEYVSYLRDIEHLDEYIHELERLISANELYLEPKLESELTNLLQWTSDVAMLLKAFRSTEDDPQWHFDEPVRQRQVHTACGLLGIALQGDIQRFADNITPLLTRRLRRPRIQNWTFEEGAEDDELSYRQSQLITHAADVIVRLMYIHYSVQYAPDEFDRLPEGQRRQLLSSFYNTFKQYVK